MFRLFNETEKSMSILSTTSTGRKMSEVSTLTNQIDSLIVSLSENEKHSPGKPFLVCDLCTLLPIVVIVLNRAYAGTRPVNF